MVCSAIWCRQIIVVILLEGKGQMFQALKGRTAAAVLRKQNSFFLLVVFNE